MGQYTKKGLLNGYKKNNKERAALDYYSSPTEEVTNILEIIDPCRFDQPYTILEPCVGGGHMMEGILKYLDNHDYIPQKIIGTDVQNRGYSNERIETIYEEDFLSDDYPIAAASIVVMNPPYATIEPFLIRALEIAQDYLIVLCRTQVLEGESRFENIFKDNPPTHIYQYVDRIKCNRNGIKEAGSSAQAYCWLVWNKSLKNSSPRLHWIRRADKK